MKIATFNVNSIKVRLPAVLAWLDAHKPDVLALQETKIPDAAFPAAEFTQRGWHVVFQGQPTYNGVALISREPMTDVRRGLNDGSTDSQCRFISGSFRGVRILNTYVPQGQDTASDKFAYKLSWLDRFAAMLARDHTPTEKLAWVGDFNIAPEDIDCYAPDFFEGEVSLTDDERKRLEALRAWGFTDAFRHFHPGKPKCYSFFDYRTKDSVKYKKGWRIDHIWVTAPLVPGLKACEIDMTPRLPEGASDHAPVWAEFDE